MKDKWSELFSKGPKGSSAEVLIFWVISLVICKLALTASPPYLARFTGVICAATWLYIPLIPMWLSRMDSSSVGATLDGLKTTGKALVVVIVVTLVPFYLVMILGGHFYYDKPIHWHLPRDLMSFSVNQLILVAFTEEFFFRGYVQTRLDDGFGWKRKLFGAELGAGTFGSAVLFALAHMAISATPLRMATIFPALIMSWLRARTGSLVAPIIFHSLANITFLMATEIFKLPLYPM